MGSTPKIPPQPPPPAKKPERSEGVAPEDVVLGGEENMEGGTLRKKGKRSLSRPAGNTGIAV